MTVSQMRRRAGTIQRLRAFFIDRGYLEVDTPLLAPSLIPESVIRPFETSFVGPFHEARRLFLVPSPELWMKRLLAEGSGNLFQISRCFRNAEQIGPQHNPEFTMLEWYTLDSDYLAQADLTDELLAAVAHAGLPDRLRAPARRMSMAEAFDELASIDLAACSDHARLREEAERAGIATSPADEWEMLFNALFLQEVEPALPRDRPLILYDYPAAVPTLAKRIPGTPWCERWELYLDGIEVANCFSEATDPGEVAAFYRHEEARIGQAEAERRSDRRFREIFETGFPRCSGVALGVDRLLMILLGVREIGGVIFFPFPGIFD